MPPRKRIKPAEERTFRAIARMSAGTAAGKVESAAPVRRTPLPPSAQVPIVGGSHTHDGSPANTTIVGGVAESGSGVPAVGGSESVVIGDFASAPGTDKGRVVIGAGTAAGQFTAAMAASGADGAIVIGGKVSTSDNERAPYAGGYADIVIGIGAETAGGTENVVIGKGAEALGATNMSNVVIGSQADSFASDGATVVIGVNADASANSGVAVGDNASANALNSMAIGPGTGASGIAGVAIGGGHSSPGYAAASADHDYSIALGARSATSATNQVAIDTRHIEFQELAADPATPAANHLRLFAKDDGGGVARLYYIDDGGTVRGPL